MKTAIASLAIAFAAGTAAAQFSGDFSDSNLDPTVLGTFGVGTTTVSGTVVNGRGEPGLPPADSDVFTFSIAAGTFLESITLTEFSSGDDLGFIAISAGTTFPFDIAQQDDLEDDGQTADGGLITDFLGGALFGVDGGGTIISDVGGQLAGATAGGSGFAFPLGEGDYTVFVRQNGGSPINYTLAFSVVPAPAAAGALGFAGLAAARRRR